MTSNEPARRQHTPWAAIAVGLGLLLVFGLLDRFSARNGAEERQPPTQAPPPPAASSQSAQKPAARPDGDNDSGLVIRNVRVLDEDQRVVYRGDIDLGPTLERINKGVRLRFSHDGSVFENRERRLPPQPRGYYHEFVQPTPGDDGPGAQRIVLGQEGEVFYTPDHYRTFRRVR